MKKILVFGATLLLAIVLVGCDVIPTNVIEKVKEFEGIEETLLEKEVMAFIDDLEDTKISNEAVCLKWYGGPDEDCDDAVEDARVRFKAGAALSKKVNILDDDSDGDAIVKATVSFDYIGHVTLIRISLDVDNSSGTLKLMIKDTEVEFSPNAEIETQIMQFVDDLSNDELSDTEVCSIWSDDEGIDNDCDLRVEPCCGGRIKHVFVFKTITPNGDDSDGNPVYQATLESEFNGHVTVLKIAFTEDDSTGKRELHIANLQQDVQMEFYPKPETLMQLEMFLEDMTNPELGIEEVCTTWFGKDGVDDDCNDRSASLVPIKHKFILKTIKPSGDGDSDPALYEATFLEKLDGHVTVLKIVFTEEDTTDKMKVVIQGVEVELPEDYYLNGEETIEAFGLFLEDYLNPEITFDQLNEDYFDGTLTEAYRIGRNATIGDYATVSLVTEGDPLPGMDLFYKMDVEFTRGRDTEVLSLHVKFIRKEFSDVKNKMMISDDGLDNDCDGICTDDDESMVLYQKYLDAYMDSSISRDELKRFFSVIPSEAYFDMRDKHVSSGASVILIGMTSQTAEGTRVVIYDIVNGDEVSRHIEPLKIAKRIDKSSPLIIIDPDDDGDTVPTEEKLAVLEELKNKLNDYSIAIEDYCINTSRDGHGETCCVSCIPRPPRGNAGAYTVGAIELLEFEGYNYIRVSKILDVVASDSDEMFVTYMVFFYYNDEGTVMFELILDSHFDFAEALGNDR